jgi:hypothetical protein
MVRFFVDFIRRHREDVSVSMFILTFMVGAASFIMMIHQMQLQTEAIKLQIEAVKSQNDQIKLQTDALNYQNEQLKFQREAMQAQMNLNKPIITQNMHCPPLQPNTVNHAEYTVYNSGRSSGVYRIRFEANNILLRASSFNCLAFSASCTGAPDHAISANNEEKYMLDLKIGDNAENPEFSVKIKCMSEDCASEPEKLWGCKYAFSSESGVYEPTQ